MTTEAEKHAEAAKLAVAALGLGTLARGLLSRGGSALANVARGGARSGAITGAGVGAAANVGREALSDKEEKNYIGAGLHGAALGAAAGGAAGHVGRTAKDLRLGYSARSGARGAADLKKLEGAELAGETAKEIGSQVANFGKRQVRGFTGKGDPGAMGLQGKAWGAEKEKLLELRRADGVKGAITKAAPGSTATDIAKKVQSTNNAHAKELAGVREAATSGQSRIDSNIDNIPGAIGGLVNKEKRKATWGAMKQHGMGASTSAKMMSVGIPVGMTAMDLSKGDESAQGGRSIAQKAVGGAVDLGTGIATGGMGILPSMAAFTAASAGADKLMGVKGAPKPQAAPTAAPAASGAPRAQPPGVPKPQVPTAGNPMRALS